MWWYHPDRGPLAQFFPFENQEDEHLILRIPMDVVYRRTSVRLDRSHRGDQELDFFWLLRR